MIWYIHIRNSCCLNATVLCVFRTSYCTRYLMCTLGITYNIYIYTYHRIYLSGGWYPPPSSVATGFQHRNAPGRRVWVTSVLVGGNSSKSGFPRPGICGTWPIWIVFDCRRVFWSPNGDSRTSKNERIRAGMNMAATFFIMDKRLETWELWVK